MKLTIDTNVRKALNPIWSFGGNTCHVPLWFREDLYRHLQMVRDELGFRYIRAHGIFSDRMEVVDAHGKFNFGKVNQALDRIVSLGLVPFVELSCMPGMFASNDKSVCQYVFRSAPPRSWPMWEDLIGSFIDNLIHHFGAEQLYDWYFEVWNEPDIPFWSGTQKEYFRLYDLARKAIKQRDTKLRVGGPATSKTAWIDDFLAHICSASQDDPEDGFRADFISTHAYPSDVEFLDGAEGEVQLQSASLLPNLFQAVRDKVTACASEEVPVFCGEWNSSAGPLASNHDECNNAAFIIKTMLGLAECTQGSLYWNISDIYEECGFHHSPFHGGYGLLTVNDIRKSSFHAFRFLNQLRGERVQCLADCEKEGAGACATIDGKNLAILLYNYSDPSIDPSRHESVSFDLTLDGKPFFANRVEHLLPEQGSAYECWKSLGCPQYVNLDMLNRLDKASVPREYSLKECNTSIMLPPSTVAILYGHLA